MIIPEIGLVAGVHTHLERSFPLRTEHELQLRMESVTRSGLKVKLTSSPGILLRPHVQHVRLEVVGTLIRLVENLIVKIQIEPQQGIRHIHSKKRLLYLGRTALIGVRDLYGRVEILSEGDRGGHQQSRGHKICFFHIHFYINSLSLSRRIRTLSRTSSDVPAAGL